MSENNWSSFKREATTSGGSAHSGTSETKSFASIKLKTIYEIQDARIVETVYGKRVVVTISEVHKNNPHDRWCFPRLGALFMCKDGLKPQKDWPTKIGFDSAFPNPYVFHTVSKKNKD